MFTTLCQLAPTTMTNFSQLGISSLMGALWWWERKYSRQREDELTAAHTRIMDQKEQLQALITALDQNTRAITQFTAAHQQLISLLQLQAPVRAAS